MNTENMLLTSIVISASFMVILGSIFSAEDMAFFFDFILLAEVYKYNADAKIMLSMFWGGVGSWFVLFPVWIIYYQAKNRSSYPIDLLARQSLVVPIVVLGQFIILNSVDSRQIKPSQPDGEGDALIVFNFSAYFLMVILPTLITPPLLGMFFSNIIDYFRKGMTND